MWYSLREAQERLESSTVTYYCLVTFCQWRRKSHQETQCPKRKRKGTNRHRDDAINSSSEDEGEWRAIITASPTKSASARNRLSAGAEEFYLQPAPRHQELWDTEVHPRQDDDSQEEEREQRQHHLMKDKEMRSRSHSTENILSDAGSHLKCLLTPP